MSSAHLEQVLRWLPGLTSSVGWEMNHVMSRKTLYCKSFWGQFEGKPKTR